MTDKRIELTRRKVLASVGAVGLAGAGAGMGTSALYSDTESIEDNTIAAGTLDLEVDWEEHYSYPQIVSDDFDDPTTGLETTRTDPATQDGLDETMYVGLPDPADPVLWVHKDDLGAYMDATELESGGPTSDPESGVVTLEDVKPGDFGELTLSYRIAGNPGTVQFCGDVLDDAENGRLDPEKEAGDTSSEAGELAENIQVAVWYDPDCDNVRSEGADLEQRADYVEKDDTPLTGTLSDVLGSISNPQDGECAFLDASKAGRTFADEYDRTCHATGADCEETLYLSESGDNPSTLYEVDLTGGNAVLSNGVTLNDTSTTGENFDQVDAIAATPDGDEVYVYDKGSGHVGVYDVGADSFEDLGQASTDPGGVVLAAFSPGGTLWIASQDTDDLYTVDTSASPPTVTNQGSTGIDLQGADLVFAGDGSLFVWTAASSDEGLYEIGDPMNDTTAVAVDNSNIATGDVANSTITGLAIRDAGGGELVGSDRQNDEIVVIDRATGEITGRFSMTRGGSGYDYDFGDMTVGELCPTYCIALAWWLPEDVGNEIQSDTVTFDVGFYAEQCRNNDGSDAA